MKGLYLPAFLLIVFAFPRICNAQQNAPVSLSVNKSSGLLEIRNGWLGIVLPSEKKRLYGGRYLAPIQSFIYSNGAYSDNSINFLNTSLSASAATIKILTQTATEVSVRISYQFQQKKFSYVKTNNKQAAPGRGYYHCTIQLRRGEKTVSIEEESNVDISYAVKISQGLQPDKARYRGWSSQSTQYGYEPDGGVYRPESTRGYPLDATVDLNYNKPFEYPRLTLWEPAGGENNTGRYWQVYNSSAGQNANLFGFFQGKPNRLLGAGGLGPSLKLTPSEGAQERQVAEVQVTLDQRWPLDTWLTAKRFQWVAWISTKKDLLSPEKSQPIGRELNRVSGLGAVINQYATEPVKLIPAFYQGAVYMPAEKVAALRKRVREDQRFYEMIYNMEPGYGPIWIAWRIPDSARSLVRQLVQLYGDLVNNYIEEEGTYTRRLRYWSGALNFKYYALAVSCLFADPTLTISAADKKKLEQLVGLMAKIVWSENNVPLADSAGINLGPANMVFQYRSNARIFFALLLANDPAFTARARQCVQLIERDIHDGIYENGAGVGSPHYQQATMDPILSSMLQLKQSGIADLFKTNKRIQQFADFYKSLCTPPSVRFMGYRKLVSFADGPEESAATFGLLASGLQSVNPELSRQLLAIYQYGAPRPGMAGTVVLAADLAGQSENIFTTGPSNYTGYLSHFRSGVNTTAESAVWLLNGESLYDHRNDDAGQVAIYAAGAPLSLNWSSFYSPHVTDARMKAVVVPEQLFPEWQTSNQPLDKRSLTNRTWPASALQQFASFKYATVSQVRMKRDKQEWYRRVYMLSLFEKEPVIVFYDSLSQGMTGIWSMPMMSEGEVSTPAGNIATAKKLHNNGDRQELPAATAVKNAPGISRFTFTGQSWKKHPAGGIDWYLFSCSDQPLQFTLSHWSNTWQNSPEQAEFQKTNGRAYSEEQQILRLKSNRPFFNILLPFHKGNDPYERRGRQVGNYRVAVEKKNSEMEFTPDLAWVKTRDDQYLALLSESASFRKAGWEASGGCMELEFKGQKVVVRVHGNSGKRSIVVPFAVRAEGLGREVTLTTTARTSRIAIQYESAGKDLAGNATGYREYTFAVK